MKNRLPLFFVCFIIFTMIAPAAAQKQRIQNFLVKENLTQNGKLAIIAVDSAERPLETVNGTFIFSINGFQQDLDFHDGIAVVKHPLETSTFVFFKHKNQATTVGKLYYIHKKNNELKPFKIHGLLLLIIPAGLLLVGYLFKRFLTVLVILALVFGYFYYAKGLDISKILESAFLTIKELF
ncbi:hypothetical protein BC792_11416 [Sphingobacterium allocomposti]|uniref:Uncharacterized protein n=2 Tax=Sphingobacterium allocomposti TaxID=415956 RepID=A0A5S5DBN8_9SPHI|nr:hypothetical protein BC792_11416 [Sphingobacterium composti Yoo et al. 2007 non Ten et al. 2007]